MLSAYTEGKTKVKRHYPEACFYPEFAYIYIYLHCINHVFFKFNVQKCLENVTCDNPKVLPELIITKSFALMVKKFCFTL